MRKYFSNTKSEINTNNKSTLVNHNTIAKLILKKQDYKGQDIRLLSCSTGECYNGLAQNLANKLGVNVLAPSDLLWAYADGKLGIGPAGKCIDPDSGQTLIRPKLPHNGEWRMFKPQKK